MSNRILIVDDDTLLRRSLAFNLEQAGYRTSTAASAEDALALADRDRPDLVLLDIGLPGMDGLEALHQLQECAQAPIIFLTARRRELDQALGLELGADDYVVKPFDLDVLLARIKAVMRRSRHSPPLSSAGAPPLTVGDLAVDPAAHIVTVGKKSVELPPREFELLYILASEPGRVISADDFLARVWGAEYPGDPQAVYVHIRWLREKIEEDPSRPRHIVTVRGVGYKLAPERA